MLHHKFIVAPINKASGNIANGTMLKFWSMNLVNKHVNNTASIYAKATKPVDKIVSENTSFWKINLILKSLTKIKNSLIHAGLKCLLWQVCFCIIINKMGLQKVRIFSNIFKFADDLYNLCKNKLDNNYKDIGSHKLELEIENEDSCKSLLLDLWIEVNDRIFTTELFDKRHAFFFYINRMSYLDGNLPISAKSSNILYFKRFWNSRYCLENNRPGWYGQTF